jgi:hypothetical protein
MQYRYNKIDIIVIVGMCAIVFGALLFFAAANGYQVTAPQLLQSGQPVDSESGMTMLQPALGQAIVEQALFERNANQAIARSVSKWNQASMAYHELQSRPGGALGAVMREAVAAPAANRARVQGVMGQAIVNFTMRGIRTGLISADRYLSDYNITMIRATEARGQRLEQEFASTWQATLGRNIVEAVQTHSIQAGAIQERLGTALLRVAQVQAGSDAVRGLQQEQLASLIVAAIRTEGQTEPLALRTEIEPTPQKTVAVAPTEPASWPDMPVGYLIAAGIMLTIVFWGGLSLAALSREEKALARMSHEDSRWVYRMAA